MTEEQNKDFYKEWPEEGKVVDSKQDYPPMTSLIEGWVMPESWKEWAFYHCGLNDQVVDILAHRFTKAHVNSKIRARNWYATWKVWASYAVLRGNTLKEKEQSLRNLQSPCPSIEMEKLCPSCQKTFSD